jgi:hypothetical protein
MDTTRLGPALAIDAAPWEGLAGEAPGRRTQHEWPRWWTRSQGRPRWRRHGWPRRRYQELTDPSPCHSVNSGSRKEWGGS